MTLSNTSHYWYLILNYFIIISLCLCLANSKLTSNGIQMILNPSTGITHTSLSTSIKLEEKLSRELQIKTDQEYIINQSDRRFLEIQLKDVWQEYQIQNEYNFTVPTISVGCVCDCPGGTDLCNKDYESSSECENSKQHLKPQCFRKYSYGHSSKGCLISSNAEMCCSTAMYKDKTSLVYRAFYMDYLKTFYKFAIELKDDNNKVLAKTAITATFVDGIIDIKTEDIENKLKVSLPKRSIYMQRNSQDIRYLVTPMWVYENPINKQIMVSKNLGLNLIDEINLSKLGWFRVENEVNKIVHPVVARTALNIVSKHCRDDDFLMDFNAVAWRNASEDTKLTQYEQGVSLSEHFHSTVDDVRFLKSNQYIEIRPKKDIEVLISMNLEFSKKIMSKYGESQFENFSGFILMDEHSNRLLFLTIEMGFGSILVQIGDSKSCAIQQVKIVSNNSVSPQKIEQSLRLNSCFVGQQLVCIYSLPTRKTHHCKMVQYREKFFTGPQARKPLTNSKIESPTSSKKENSINVAAVVLPIACTIIVAAVLIIIVLFYRRKKKSTMY